MNKIDDWTWVDIPNGESAAVAKYNDHKLPEYNNNPLIQALPPILSGEEFIEKAIILPSYAPEERELAAHRRFHCVERLSRYFQPLNKTVNLQQVMCALLMQGYIARNISKPDYARRSRQIYEAIKAGDGKNLDVYVNVPTSTSASGLTLIGPSGMGKSTNFINILNLYPQVILHPEYSTYQIVWLKVDCPHAGSLKGLCTDIFLGIDRLLGTNYFKKFGASRNSEDYMLAQVAQIAHTHHLGVLVIDEMQNLVTARRSCSDMLNFLVKMDNIIGVPVIRIGTNEAFPILQGNFRNARRGTGEGSVIWDRMRNDDEWYFFMETMWEYQWTKISTDFSDEFNDVFYDESQGIIDIAIKLYKMVQWRAISLSGKEEINVNLIKKSAKDGLFLVKPMLNAIRSGDKEWMIKYKDIAPIDTTEYYNNCLSNLETKDLQEISRLAKKQQTENGHLSATQRHIILKLLELDVEPQLAKECAAQVINSGEEDADIPMLVKQAYTLALGGQVQEATVTKVRTSILKAKPKYQVNDIRQIAEKAKKNQTSAYEGLKSAGIIKDPVQDFITNP
ncbi:ATP-binding protein [Calothrix sp. FACHB-1219]|uniref:AAA family ATPase n=1 Tax=unclassified Calothrix TaxID=2619626 RepID=UPI0016872AB2|nr:AAA family ATPase [Calothrix sp. FACHB-168]MBD2203541.1 ATP-binding protein [Calothrix sp. FACHB-168]MBD2221152.1 ATP-binding protein [Calothrix sp. FACHB-1219]